MAIIASINYLLFYFEIELFFIFFKKMITGTAVCLCIRVQSTERLSDLPQVTAGNCQESTQKPECWHTLLIPARVSVFLSYVASSRPAWATVDSVLNWSNVMMPQWIIALTSNLMT